MKKSLASAAFVALLLVFAAPQARAQAQIEIGPRVGYEIDDLQALSVGADLRVSTFALPFQLNAAFDYYFPEDFDDENFDPAEDRDSEFVGADNIMRFTANALYQAGINNQYFTPYFGPGLSVVRISRNEDFINLTDEDDSVTELGLNAVGGIEFGIGGLRPFVQAEVGLLGDAQPTQITGGLLFTIGGM